MALYHKHRPQDFKSIVGQEHIVETLQNQVSADKVAHAYLFSGPRGVGKTTSARILAKAINCEKKKQGDAKVCNSCNSCKEITEGRSIDVIEIDAASHTGVDNVRENIIDNAQFKPTTLPYKIFIIDEVHMLSTSAFNALLKTLEEPPEHAIFILATTEKHKLPETIISRCQVFDYKKVGFDLMKKHLKNVSKDEGVEVEDDVLSRIINKSDGCVRDAISLLDQIMATGEKKLTTEVANIVLPTSHIERTTDFVEALVKKEMQDCLNKINSLVEDGVNLSQFAHDSIELLRILLVGMATGKDTALAVDLSKDAQKRIKGLSEAINHPELVRLIDLLIKRKAEIKTAPIPQLPLELAVIEWCSNNTTHDTHNTTKDFKENEKSKQESPESNITPVTPTKKESNEDQVPSFSFEQVKEAWSQCVKKMEADAPSLVFILKSAEVKKVEGNTIYTQVQYNFHRDKLLETNCKEQVCKVLSEILNSNVHLETSVSERKGEPNKELSELAAAFGGEVV